MSVSEGFRPVQNNGGVIGRGKAWMRSQPAWLWVLWPAVLTLHLWQFDVTWFSIDATRDVLQAADIASGRHFPLNGPQMHWIAHIGPLYYYVLALAFLVAAHPYAAYVLVAAQATLTVVLSYYFLRRYFSPRAGFLFLALYIPNAVVLLDSRALWTPAFLPLWAILALWAAAAWLWDGRQAGLVALAVVFGMATQFHLSFVLLIPVCVVGLVLYRPTIRFKTSLLAVALGTLTYAPYLYFQSTHDWVDIRAFLGFANAAQTAGTNLVKAGFAERFWNYLLIPAQLGDVWFRREGAWLAAFDVASLAVTFLQAAAAVTLAGWAFSRWRPSPDDARKGMLLVAWMVIPLVLLLNRGADLYYYYFDLLLPAPFLILGIVIDKLAGRLRDQRVWPAIRIAGLAALAVGAAIQLTTYFGWSRDVAREGAFHLTIDTLDLHRFSTASPRMQDTFVSLRAKIELARFLTGRKGWSRAEIYDKVMGSRFYDATEERGYWVGFFRPFRPTPWAADPIVLWHRSDPLEKWARELQVAAEEIGAYRVGVLDSKALPGPWIRGDGIELRMPVRTVPDVREYGFVPPLNWPPGPVLISGGLDVGNRPTRYLLVVITKGDKITPRLKVNGTECGAASTFETQMTAETFFTLEQSLSPGPNRLELSFDRRGDFDLDVFGWAKW